MFPLFEITAQTAFKNAESGAKCKVFWITGTYETVAHELMHQANNIKLIDRTIAGNVGVRIGLNNNLNK